MHHLDAGPRDGPARRARRDSPLSEKLGSLRYALKNKLRDYLGIFPKWRTPPTPPLLGTP